MPNLLNPSSTKLSLPIPAIDDSILTGKVDGSLTWIDQTTLYKTVDNIIYVAKNGKDTNSGKSISFPKSSIKSALSAARSGTTIIVASGTYIEYTPLICPPEVTITAQDSTVQVISRNDSNDVFYLNSGTVIEGLTIVNIRAPGVAFSIKSPTQILKTPIIKNCSVVSGPFLNDNTLFIPNQTVQIQGEPPTNLPIINNDLVPIAKQVNETGSGTGILIDGSAFTANSTEKLVIVDSCNIISQGGIGILVKNSAKCHAVNCELKFCNIAYKTETGGELLLNSCTSSYGNYALYANGIDPIVITSGIITDAIAGVDPRPVEEIIVSNLTKQPTVGMVAEIRGTYYTITNATKLTNGISWLSLLTEFFVFELSDTVTLYNRSEIIANNHYFNYVGSGVTYNALSENNGQKNDNNNITQFDYGAIYQSSNDSSGTFKVGNLFVINQITGEITVTPSVESLINIGSIGPLIRNGIAVGVQMKEISNNNQLISSTGEIDQFTVPTQLAIYNYLNNNYLPLTGGEITGSTSIQDITLADNIISSVNLNQNIKIAPTGTGSIDVDFSNIINLAEPINDNDAATKKFVVDLVQGGVAPPSIIPILWGSNQDDGTLILRSTQSAIKPDAGVILDDEIPSTSVDTGTLVVRGGVGISGALNARTKSFIIDHPLDPNKKLQYGSLESPYYGIRLTGKGVVVAGECIVKLPNYISKLVKEQDAQIQLTNIKHNKILWVENIDISHNQFTVKNDEIDGEYQFFWSFTGIRIDVDELVVEHV